MNSKAYSSRNVNHLPAFLPGREGMAVWVGMDIGKKEIQVVLQWADGSFERPWKVVNPTDIRVLVGHLSELAQGREMTVAMEPSGTYGDALRQACHDAGIFVHRVHTKITHDYAEVFDGVPSQHDGKDAAVIAELSRHNKSVPWPWEQADETMDQIRYWVSHMDNHRRLLKTWTGRIEALLARYWPEAQCFKRTSPTLLGALVKYGGPAALAADVSARDQLKAWSRNHLSTQVIARIIDDAKRSSGVRQQAMDLRQMREYAQAALEAKEQMKQARRHLFRFSQDQRCIQAMTPAVGNATACLLFVELGQATNYHCAAAYVKAMGLNLAERSSGRYKGRLRISKRGSAAVRYWMYLAAMRQVKTNSPVRPWYLRKKQRDAGKNPRAMMGVMRRLGLALYHIAVNGEAFDAKRLFPGKRKARAAV